MLKMYSIHTRNKWFILLILVSIGAEVFSLSKDHSLHRDKPTNDLSPLMMPCQAAPTIISPASPLSLPEGDPGLNLGLSNNLGSVVTGISGTLANTDALGLWIYYNQVTSGCVQSSTSTYYDSYTFSVSISGNYTINHGGTFGTILNLYSSPFTGTNCSNHLISSAVDANGMGSLSFNNSLTASLQQGQLYTLVVSGYTTNFPALPSAYNVTFTNIPSGPTIFNGVQLPTQYSYTYIAVNNSGIVTSFNNNSDFTSLTAGSYSIYGLMYYSGAANPPGNVNINNIIGQALSTIANGSLCLSLSSNFKPLTVTPSCTQIVSNTNDSGPGSLRATINCVAENSTITFASGITHVALASSLTITKNVTLQGQSSTSRPEIRTTSAGITINSGKILTLQNVDIKHQGNQTLNGAGQLVISGTTVGRL
jgi:hypothetical protein